MMKLIRACCAAVACTFPLAGCDRLLGKIYEENGHVEGGALKWISNSTCAADALGQMVELAAHDTPGTSTIFRESGTFLGFDQSWPAPDDASGYPKRQIDYYISFAANADRSPIINIYAEASKQRGGSMPSVEFDEEYKLRVKQFMDAFLLRGKECGLSPMARIRYG